MLAGLKTLIIAGVMDGFIQLNYKLSGGIKERL